jgi:hypothetical protein
MELKEKEKALAELMEWELELIIHHNQYIKREFLCISNGGCGGFKLQPYSNTNTGLAQFAAIFLKYPDVMAHFMDCNLDYHTKPTQEAILDEIIKQEGKWIVEQ